MLLQRSLWEETAVPAPDLPRLAGAHEAEVAVIGAGFAGLSSALALAERGVPTVVLEADELGAGASGRNGGQVIPGLRHFPEELVAAYGVDRGRRLYELGAGTADTAFALIRRHRLECDAIQEGWINAADTEAGMELARRRAEAWSRRGVPVRLLDRAAIRELTGSNAYSGGWIDPRGGAVQPLSLVRELARAACGAGAAVRVHSPALAIDRDGADWRVTTPEGRLKARRVLVATNALAGSLIPQLARTFLPVWSFQIATDPLPAEAGVMRTGAVVSDTRRVLRYFRSDRNGRLLVGGKGTVSAPAGLRSFGFQRQTLARLYPQLAGTTPTFYWGGQVSVTVDRLPRLFVLDDGVLATLGCNGKGIAWNLALGPVLADALTGADLEKLPLPPACAPRQIPFHGLKRIYAAAGGTWLRLRDGLEQTRRLS